MDNLTDAQYLELVLGPQHMGLHVLLPMTAIYSAIFLTGVLGNICVCLVIIRHKSLHTATNYYLFSLAISDLVILVLGLPNELVTYWQQYPWMFGEQLCKVRALISEIAVKIITGIWFVSFMAACPYAYFTQINYVDRQLETGTKILNESAMCALLEINIPEGYPLYQISSIMFFILPLCILLYLYARMGIILRRSDMPSASNGGGGGGCNTADSGVHGAKHKYLVLKMLGKTGSLVSVQTDGGGGNPNGDIGSCGGDSFTGFCQRSNKRGIIGLLVAVVVVFFLCWAPFHAQRLGVIYLKRNVTFIRIHEYLFYISGFFYYFSATVNPILYNVMSLKYRHAFKATLCGKYQPTGPHRSYTFRSTMRRTTDTSIPLTSTIRNQNSQRGRASTIEEENINETGDVVT